MNLLMSDHREHGKTDFIPARESKIFITLFGWYTRLLFKRRFKSIWLRQDYQPQTENKTVYFLNHSSWWDGIIPLLLNNYLFHQQARAIMEDKQMIRYPFFRRIGAFSVNLENNRKTIQSLKYALESMERPNASLFIYPEGRMVPFSTDKPDFRGGLAWMYKKLPEIDFVPIGIYIHTLRYDKPELHIRIGKAVSYNGDPGSTEELQEYLETELQKLLIELHSKSGINNSGFVKWI
jgi:chlorobactene lauroyltransferase